MTPPTDDRNQPLAGRVALVTGAGGGIGAAVAARLAADGARVVVNDLGVALDGAPAESTAAQAVVDAIDAAGGEAIADPSDIAEFAQVEQLVARAVDTFGRLDAVVHVAGIVRDRMIFNMTEEEWDDVVRVHLKGAFNLARHASAHWRAHRGGDYRLVNVTSGAGMFGAPGQPNYAAAKAGIVGLTLSCANALTRYGVSSVAVWPGARTRMSATVSPELAEKVGMNSDEMRPESVAPGFSYLVGPGSAWLNGQVVGLRGHRLQLYSPAAQRLEVVGSTPWDHASVADAFETHFRPVVEGRGIFDPEETP